MILSYDHQNLCEVFIVLKHMTKLMYVATSEVILKVYFQSRINCILNSFGYIFQILYVCILLRLNCLPLWVGLQHLLFPTSLHTRAQDSSVTELLSFRSVMTWKLQWLRSASLKQMFNCTQEQSYQKKKA